MILPDNLAPLPVVPRGEDAELECEDFVNPGEVRRLLLGSVSSVVNDDRSSVDSGPFAGRGDAILIEAPSRLAFEAGAEGGFEGRGLHPAFERLPQTRRAAPPRVPVDREEGFGRSGLGDRWWVIGMGLAAAAVLFSGTAVDFISREAVRRSQAATPPVRQVAPPAPGTAAQVERENPASLAATVEPEDRP